MTARGAGSLVLVLLMLMTGTASASQPGPSRGTVNALEALAAELAAHPEAEAADVYKFLHQALFGPGHAITDRSAAALYLREEMAELGPPLEAEPACTTLGGEPILVRVNLRPFKQQGFEVDSLVEAFADTAEQVRGEPSQMEVALRLATAFLEDERRPDLARELDDLAREMKRQGYPAVHHTAAYREACRPAYRVVAGDLAADHGWCGTVEP